MARVHGTKKRTADPPAFLFLPNAPESLRYLHSVSGSGKALLARLLSFPKMKAVWETLEPQFAKQQREYPVKSPQGPYRLLYAELTRLLIQHRRERKPKSALENELDELKEQVTKLRRAVVPDDSRTGAATKKTGTIFDVEMYEYFPPKTMALSVSEWLGADQLERTTLANRLLVDWPTLGEVLGEWLSKIDERIEDTKALPAMRARGPAAESNEETKRNAAEQSLADRIFVVSLVKYIEGSARLGRKQAIDAAAEIARATLWNEKDKKKNITPTFVTLALRAI